MKKLLAIVTYLPKQIARWILRHEYAEISLYIASQKQTEQGLRTEVKVMNEANNKLVARNATLEMRAASRK